MVGGAEYLALARFEIAVQIESGVRSEVGATVVGLAGGALVRAAGGTTGGMTGGTTGAELGSGIRLIAASGSAMRVASGTAAGTSTRAIASLRRPRTSVYVCSGNGSINLRRRRISNNAFGDEPVAMSSRCSCARTSASVNAPLSDALTTFLNTEVSATGAALTGSSSPCAGAAVAGGPGVAGTESWVRSGAVSRCAFCVSSATAALAAARSFASLSSFASLRRWNTCACADSGNGSTNSRRRRISNSSVADAPVASSNSTSDKTSGHVNPPVSNARNTFEKTAAAGEILVPICVVRRRT